MAAPSSPSSSSKLPTPLRRPRALSTQSVTDTSAIASSRSPRQTAISLLGSAKKFTTALSSDSGPRLTSKPSKPSLSAPGTPTKRRDGSRPRTPNSPRTPRSTTPFSEMSDMDVSRIDPEEAVVDFRTVEPGDASGDLEDTAITNYGREDKVLVSIRIRPTDETCVWQIQDASQKGIKLDLQYAKSDTAPPQDFRFDEILTGSENASVYNAVARSHVYAAMDGYNAVIFAYGQTASGKTFTLTGDETQPGIIPRAMKEVFAYIRRTPTREYLLRCSYLEIYNETIHDLLAPPTSSVSQPVQIQGAGASIVLTPLREEVVTSLKGVQEVLERGEGNRRTASTDWNERSSRSHSVFRLVIESRERGGEEGGAPNGRTTPGTRPTTPGTRPSTPGGPKLQAKGGKIVQMSVLSLIDLAGSEKATSDKERTREGKYINTSLLTLGTVIATLAENSSKNKNDHVPFRNSKLTRMLQPSLLGDARISVICTINPSVSAIAESTSTLLFAQRVKKVQLHAQKREVLDTDALLERYKKEIDELKKKLADRESTSLRRRRSVREQMDESKAMSDLNNRIQQLTKLILTSQTMDENRSDQSRSASPSRGDFDMSPYQLQEELLAARRQIETQTTQILSLEAALLAKPQMSPDAPVSESDKDKLLAEQANTIHELEIVIKGYEKDLEESSCAARENIEKEWREKLESEVQRREEKTAWADELMKQLEKERRMRVKLEEERQALTAFVKRFDSLGLGNPLSPIKLSLPMPIAGGADEVFEGCQKDRVQSPEPYLPISTVTEIDTPIQTRVEQASLLDEEWDAVNNVSIGDLSTSLSSGFRRTSQDWPSNAVNEKESMPVQ
ncbi:kinesin-domain-containing protein [Laetiporus sulphureus 93-53]|uniref:Kinesin-like protein n=1 Tax=Laetiporus sulphureus 93-53 TaxID=1314785 RepID=A0A165HNG6_9APHY|nr:kinesin-domain-containing protein [Laetiporus sulphureus 93-53]KZT11970.1 kinesin-domain-containing protein [Laetiporus sulphureus 93-53]